MCMMYPVSQLRLVYFSCFATCISELQLQIRTEEDAVLLLCRFTTEIGLHDFPGLLVAHVGNVI